MVQPICLPVISVGRVRRPYYAAHFHIYVQLVLTIGGPLSSSSLPARATVHARRVYLVQADCLRITKIMPILTKPVIFLLIPRSPINVMCLCLGTGDFAVEISQSLIPASVVKTYQVYVPLMIRIM